MMPTRNFLTESPLQERNGTRKGPRGGAGSPVAPPYHGRMRRSLALVALLYAASCAHPRPPATDDPLSPGMHHAVLNGVDLAWHVAGHGPVMIAHPGGPGGFWEYLRMPLVERSWTVVYLEPVGTGASGKLPSRADYTMGRYVDDVEALRAHLKLER